MPNVGDSTLGTIEFSLLWHSADARHLERLHAHKVNFLQESMPLSCPLPLFAQKNPPGR